MLFYEELLIDHENLIRDIIKFFLSPIVNLQLHQDIKEKCSNQEYSKHIFNHDNILKLNGIFKEDFIFYMNLTNKYRGIHIPSLDTTLKLLMKNNLIIEYPTGSLNGMNLQPFYGISGIQENAIWIDDLFQNDLILNYLFGFDYIIKKYKKSIFKIEVENSDGDLSLGTGFLYSSKDVVVTNKHVIKDRKIISITNDLNQPFNFDPLRTKSSNNNDIALIYLKEKLDIEGLIPSENLDILAEIITMGYPRVPTSRNVSLVIHRGQVNSTIENFQGNQLFLISARTSPGSSGSPIIDKTGRFIGIVSENLFEQEFFKEKGILPYHAGVPASLVQQFYRSFCGAPSWVINIPKNNLGT
jgi:hypothetical protein